MRHILHIVHWEMSGIYGVAKNLKQQGTIKGDKHEIVLLRHNKSFVDKLISYCRIIELVVRLFLNKKYVIHCHSFLPLLVAYVSCTKNITFTIHNAYPFFSEKSRRSRLKKWLMRSMLKNRCVKSSSVSSFVAESAQKGALIGSRTILNGLDISKYPFNYTAKAIKTIGSAGRLDEQKNYGALVKAFSLIESANITLVIAGDGVQLSELKSEIVENKLSGKVRLIGYQEDIIKFFSNIDGFICSSLYEGLNLIVIEAMLVGVPVISTNVGVAIEANELGLPIMGFKSHEMASAIESWVNTSPEMHGQQVKLNREFAVKYFDISKIYDEYRDFLWGDVC